MTLRFATAVLLTGAAIAGLAASAGAHGRSVSYSTWSFDDTGARVRVRVTRLDLTRLAVDPVGSRRDSERVGRMLADQLVLSSGGRSLTRPSRY